MEFFEKNGKLVVGAFFALIAVGLIVTFVSSGSKRNEEQAQEKLAKIEIEYTKYKEEVTNSTTPPAPPTKDDKKNKEAAAAADIAKAEAANLRNGLIVNLNQFINDNKKTIATEMAALYLSELLIDENKNAEA